MSAAKARGGVVGAWRIVDMELWDADAMDLCGPASISFNRDGAGTLRFIAVEAELDWRADPEDQSRIHFSFDGFDEGDPVTGRGWVAPRADGSLDGRIFFHHGDDSGFRATRE